MGVPKSDIDAMLARIRANRPSSILGTVVSEERRIRIRKNLNDRPYVPPSEEDGMITFFIDPCPAPRQSRRDAWNPRPSVERYREWKDSMKRMCAEARWSLGDELRVDFNVPMPQSWSDKKRLAMAGKPHQQRPDVDNFSKALMDLQGLDDGHVHTLHAVKRWADEGSIVIYR